MVKEMIEFIAYLIALLKILWPIIVLAIAATLLIMYPLADMYERLSVWWTRREINRIKRSLRK